MIYGQDDPMLFPVADLYDSGMMNMYINAAREQYNQNREDMKDFMKTYGDFISPISADMDWVDQQTRGRINDALNYLQQNGIDPLRSAEGRAIIQRVIRDTPTAGINARRQSAENAKEYLKNKAALERQGLYNPNFESYRLGGNTINNWNTGDNGIWQETSPLEYKDLNQYTGHIFDKMEDEFISSDGIYDYTGVSRERRNQALTQQIGGLLNTPLGRFHYENSRANAAAILGREPTEEEVLNQFKNDILTATVEYERRNRKENPEYARRREFYYSDKLDAAKSARDLANAKALDDYKTKNQIALAQAKDGGTTSSSGSGKTEKESLSDAQYQLMRGTTGIISKTYWGRNANINNYTDFDPDWMDNILPAAQEEIGNKFYDNSISGGDYKLSVKQRPLGEYNPKTGKLQASKNKIKFDIRDVNVNYNPYPPAVTKSQLNNLKTANRKFINELSVDYTPKKFAVWTNKPTSSIDDTMVNISNDEDAINRIVSVDEVALSSAGVPRPIEDLQKSRAITDGIRKKLKKRDNNIYMKSVGKMTTPVSSDGSVHTYQLIKVYDLKGNSKNHHHEELDDSIGIVLYDMGIDTYSNPNFGINNNTHVNLYFDENKDADVRWSGDQSVLHWEHVGNPNIESTIAYPELPKIQ